MTLKQPTPVRRVSSFLFGQRKSRISLAFVVAGVVLVGFPFFASDYYVDIVGLAFVASIIAVATNLLTGQAGLYSIGNAAFLAIAAWVTVIFSNRLGFVGSTVVATLVCAAIGLLIGIPSLRLRNFYMVLTTLALQFIVSTAFTQYEIVINQPTGFFLPIATVGPLAIGDVRSWYVLLAVVLVIVLAASWALISSRVGRAWLAIREHDVAAAVIGVNVTYYKLLAFAVSSGMIGFAGALFAYLTRYISPEAYTLDLAISYVAMIIIGGLGSLYGSVIGAFIVTLLPLLVNDVGGLLPQTSSASGFISQNQFYIQTAIYGAIVLVFLYRQPRGIAGIVKQISIRGRTGRRAGMANFDAMARSTSDIAPMQQPPGGAR